VLYFVCVAEFFKRGQKSVEVFGPTLWDCINICSFHFFSFSLGDKDSRGLQSGPSHKTVRSMRSPGKLAAAIAMNRRVMVGLLRNGFEGRICFGGIT